VGWTAGWEVGLACDEEGGEKGEGGRRGNTDYSSHRTGGEVLPAVQLDLRFREGILNFRHLGCYPWNLTPLNRLLSHSEAASMDSACTTRTPEPTERSIDQQTTIEGRLNEREGKERGQSSALFFESCFQLVLCAVTSLIRERPVVSGRATLVRHTSLVECGMGALIGALTVQCAYNFWGLHWRAKKIARGDCAMSLF
jgi:hypothetical protein